MRDHLETFYENELQFIRNLALEFARDRPKIADRLLLERESGVSEDPHVERLIESFALLTARIRLKLEDEFPELSEALLSILYPHYLAPLPSMAIVEFQVDPTKGTLTTGHTIAKQSRIYSRKVGDVACRFRTCYPVTLWPIQVAGASYQCAPFSIDVTPPEWLKEAKAVIRISLRSLGGINFSDLELDQLRFFLSGEFRICHYLYELMFNHVGAVQVAGNPAAPPIETWSLDPDVVLPVGFEKDEGILPYGKQSFLGYRLLAEYFAFPMKFLFFDLSQLEPVVKNVKSDSLEIRVFLTRDDPWLESQVKAELFRLGCTPVVNLFTQEADPIRLTHTKAEYHVLPDVRHPHALEVYSIDEVTSSNLDTGDSRTYRPFYSFRHGSRAREQSTYWYSSRRPSVRKNDPGTEVYLSLVDLNFNPTMPAADVLVIKTTCSNRNLPTNLRAAGGESWGFQLEGQAPYSKILPVVAPTQPNRLPFGESRWRLISHLALNHLSITDDEDGGEALREILRLYDYACTRVTEQHISGIVSVKSSRGTARISDGTARGFCRGIEVDIEFDHEKFAGGGLFLISAVLDRFLGLYTSINSFTRLSCHVADEKRPFKIWPYRAGYQTLT